MAFRIYKKGQGVWARSVSAACLGLFLVWGCVTLYGSPGETGQVGEAKDELTAELLDQMKAEGVVEVWVEGQDDRIPIEQVKADAKLTLSKPGSYRSWWVEPAAVVPGIDVTLRWGHLVAVLVFLPGAYFVFWMVNRERHANFLIETESELKKVSWSTKKEVIASSKVVVVFVIMMALILWFYDQVFKYAVIILRDLVG